MKPLILLTAMTVIGLFGIIGTVEYLEAQTPTPLTIPPPTTNPDTGGTNFNYKTDTGNIRWYSSASNEILQNTGEVKIGSIYFPADTHFQPNPILTNATNTYMECFGLVISVKDILENSPTDIQGLTAPDNITPQGNNTIHAIGIDFSAGGEVSCTIDIEAPSSNPVFIETGKNLQITITDKHDKAPYYFSPRDNITQAQSIPICTTTNFDTTTQTLKGTQEMCYGKNGNDMVIISKRLMGFYGTADTVTEPASANKVDFTGTPKTTQPANNNNDDSSNDDSDEYIALLKRLYLPPI